MRSLSPPLGSSPKAGSTCIRPRRIVLFGVASALFLAVGGGGLALALQSANTVTSTPATTTTPPASSGVWTVPASESYAPAIPIAGGSATGVAGFNAVACVTSSSCFAAGASGNGQGALSTSTNGGSTWTSVPTPSGLPTLDALSCPTTSLCVAGGPGVLVRSSDAGVTWTVAAPPTTDMTILGMSCSSSSLCTAVGVTPGVDAPDPGAIVTSLDGGVTWTAVAVPGLQALGSVSCPSTTYCVAVGQQIEVSLDGAKTWNPKAVAGGTGLLRSVACSSVTSCLAVGPNPAMITTPQASAFVLSSSDGGSSWTDTAAPAQSGSVDFVSCALGGRCVLTGLPDGSVGPVLLSTGDVGATWTPMSPPTGLSAVASMSCASTSCVFTGQGSSGAVSGVGSGTSWTVASSSVASIAKALAR